MNFLHVYHNGIGNLSIVLWKVLWVKGMLASTTIYISLHEDKKHSTVKPALSDHRFKRPPAFSDRFFMHGESAIQNDLY